MNELLQKHGCSNVFSVPEGLKELMADISREVLRAQPPKINDFIANYLSVLLITREHGLMAVKILDDLCDCRPSVLEHLLQLELDDQQARTIADIIKEEIEGTEEVEGKETIREYQIIKKILAKQPLDEALTAQVCQIARNAYRDYWYRKKTLKEDLKITSDVPWEIAAEHTLEIYKRTKPSFSELTRATEKIQAAYRGYHVRRNILKHLKPKSKKKRGPKVALPGPPLDIGGSREIDLGPMIDIKVRTDNINTLFGEHTTKALGLAYDPLMTITHVADEQEPLEYTILQQRKSRSPTQETPSSNQAQPNSSPHHQSRPPSRLPSVAPPADPANMKITFANEAYFCFVSKHEGHDNHEFRVGVPPESIRPTSRAPSEYDAAEVPEDIVDNRSEADGASACSASVPSSARSTANTTDVEDLNVSDAEE